MMTRMILTLIDFDDIALIDEDRDDKIFSFNADLERKFELGDRQAALKIGFKRTRRDREFLRGENSFEPGDLFGTPGSGFIPETLAGIATFTPLSTQDTSGGLAGGSQIPEIQKLSGIC